MTLCAVNFETQGNFSFAELFGRIFPSGADTDKVNRFIDYKHAVEARLHTFRFNERFNVDCYCESCNRHSYVPVWEIAEALQAQTAVSCNCEKGNLIPVYKEKVS